MTNSVCFFDLLPVELLHTVFSYFLAHDILFSFSNISSHVDAVLLTYIFYHVNFKSISKADFDRICHRIRPNQVFSLVLSDNSDTPGQTEIFLSRFRIEQFTQLRSLTLINIELDTLSLILDDLNKFNQLRSFSFPMVIEKTKYNPRVHNYSTLRAQVNNLLPKVYMQVLPRLSQLSLSSGNTLSMIPLQRLYSLTLTGSTVDELQMIFIQTRSLKSLDVCINDNISKIEYLHSYPPLRRLSLMITNSEVSMDQIERFLPNLPYLKHLTLQIYGSEHLGDGHRWERLTAGYTTFHFRFKITVNDIPQVLESFSTPFWLQVKRWYVAYHDKYLFSVSKFAPNQVSISYNPQNFTALNKTFLYSHVTELQISRYEQWATYCFDNVETLEFRRTLDYTFPYVFPRLSNDNQEQLDHPLDHVLLFPSYLLKLRNCHKLLLDGYFLSEFIKKLSGNRFKQIRTLEIHGTILNTHPIVEDILCFFPRVEHLYISSASSFTDISRLIDGFKYLSNASFTDLSKFTENEQKWIQNSEFQIHKIRRLRNDAFTYRFDYLSFVNNSPSSVHIWINRERQQPFWIAHWPPRRGYIWHRIKRLIIRHLAVTSSDLYFFVIPWSLELARFLSFIMVHPISRSISFGVIRIIYGILYIIGNRVLSRSQSWRNYNMIVMILFSLIYILEGYFGFDHIYLLANYLSRIFK